MANTSSPSPYGYWRRERSSIFSPAAIRSGNDRSSLRESLGDSNPLLDNLYHAIESRDSDIVLKVLSNGKHVDVNQVVPGYSMSLLHIAVGFSENETDIVELLLRHGGDPNNQVSEEKLSPLHLSAIYDYDMVMSVLIEYDGDPKMLTEDGKTCYDIAKENVEDEMLEKCFGYFFMKSRAFRKSMGVSTQLNKKQITVHDSGSDGFYSCESQLVGESNSQNHEGLLSVARKLFPSDYSYLMTEDESVDSDSDDDRRKLTTIPEESCVVSSRSNSGLPFSPSIHQRRGICSMTAPQYLLTDDSISIRSEFSCVNSTPPITPQPTKEEMEKLHEQMKRLNIPITPSTFGVISKYTESESQLQTLLSPKTGSCNFSSELQAAIQNLNLIHDWGNLKIDLLHNATPTANTSKSFFNYLLLDPKIIKRANFSGNHLKTGVINNSEKFEKFLLSVFYIGKGRGKRPLQHLVDAKAKFVEMGKKPFQNGQKIDKILEVWKSGQGVIILSMFHHSSEREANVNEACMIDAVGLVELSNLKKGSYNGLAQGWPQKTKNQLGSLLLYKSFCTFVVSDCKSFFPEDF